MSARPQVELVPELVGATGAALDAGCGLGEHAVILANAGLSVDAFDLNARAIDRLRAFAAEHELPINAFTADLCSFVPGRTYDAVLVMHVLHQIPGDAAATVLARLQAAVRAGGVMVAGTVSPSAAIREVFAGAHEGRAYWDAGELRKRFATWEIIAENSWPSELIQRRPDGTAIETEHNIIVARRA